MSDSEEPTENDFIEDPEPVPDEKPVRKGKKGKQIVTEDRLQVLARAREKALAVRKANAEARGKGKVREEAKAKADANKKDADEKFNKRVEEEINKRMGQLHLDKINEVVEQKITQSRPPKKPKKKVIYEDSESSEEEEVIVRRRRPRKTIIEKVVEPAPAPAPEPAPPPIVKQEPLNPYVNMLRTIPHAGLRSSRNPYYRNNR